jgi:hypothetical protein
MFAIACEQYVRLSSIIRFNNHPVLRKIILRLPMFFAVMHKAQVRLEDSESSIEIEIEIGIEIDSVQFYASV